MFVLFKFFATKSTRINNVICVLMLFLFLITKASLNCHQYLIWSFSFFISLLPQKVQSNSHGLVLNGFFKRPCGYIFEHLLYGFLGWLFQVPRWIPKVFWVILAIWQAPESKNRWFLALEAIMVRQQKSKSKNLRSWV